MLENIKIKYDKMQFHVMKQFCIKIFKRCYIKNKNKMINLLVKKPIHLHLFFLNLSLKYIAISVFGINRKSKYILMLPQTISAWQGLMLSMGKDFK